jgi:hypothetical protein
MELSSGRGHAQFDTRHWGQVFDQGLDALLGGQPSGVEQAQVAGGRAGGPGRRITEEVVGDAPGYDGDLPAVDVWGELAEAVGHCRCGYDDGVGRPRGLAQHLQLVAVSLGEDQVRAVDQGDAGMQWERPDQGGGGAEGEVL